MVPVPHTNVCCVRGRWHDHEDENHYVLQYFVFQTNQQNVQQPYDNEYGHDTGAQHYTGIHVDVLRKFAVANFCTAWLKATPSVLFGRAVPGAIKWNKPAQCGSSSTEHQMVVEHERLP